MRLSAADREAVLGRMTVRRRQRVRPRGIPCGACGVRIAEPFGLKACPNCGCPFNAADLRQWIGAAESVYDRMVRQGVAQLVRQ